MWGFKPVKFRLKINLESHPGLVEGLNKYISLHVILSKYDAKFYSDLKRSTSRSLSSVEGCYVECVSPRVACHLTHHKINPSQFRAYEKQTNNVDANSRLDWSQTSVRGCRLTFTYTTKFFVLLPPHITEEWTSRLDNINCRQISKSSCNI